MRPAREVTAEEENYRLEPWIRDNMLIGKRDPIEPEPVGTFVAMVFRITGYDQDCDGSLMARLQCVDRHGDPTGWEPDCLGIYPDVDIVVTGPGELWDLCEETR